MKRVLIILLCFILALAFMPTFAYADDDDIDILEKTATLSSDEKMVTIDIQSHYTPRAHVLVYQGTFCTAHGLKNTVLIDAINSLLEVSDLDYFAATLHYSKNEHKFGALQSFSKGTTVGVSDIYSTISESGNHIVSPLCLDMLMNTLDNGNYSCLVMILDGGFATGSSGGSNDNIFFTKVGLLLSDEQYIQRMHYAEKLADTHIVYLVAPKSSSDAFLIWDNSSSKTYGQSLNYWDESNRSTTTNTTASLGYLNAHLFFEGLAFLSPEYYLNHIDPVTGKPNVTTPPPPENIEYDTDAFVDYSVATQVAQKIEDTKGRLIPTEMTITDELADGLTFDSGAVQYYDEETDQWMDFATGSATIECSGQTVTAHVVDSHLRKGLRIRLMIQALPDDELGKDGLPVDTNDSCTTTFRNDDDEIVHTQEVDPPQITFTTFDVNYDPGNHGTLTGIDKESFKVAVGGTTSGSSVTADDHFTHTGWTCDKNVTLTDGTVIPTGELLSNEQIAHVKATETITFTAQYEGSGQVLIDYVVNPDPVWGTPEDSVTPPSKTANYGEWITVEPKLSTNQDWATNPSTHETAEGIWTFSGWSTDDFQATENTTIVGSWKFSPNLPKTGSTGTLAFLMVGAATLTAAFILTLRTKRG